MADNQQVQSIRPRFAGLTGLLIFAWIIFAIFSSLDEDKYYFSLSMLVAGILTAYQLRYSRVNRNPVQGGSTIFYVIIWLAVFSFTPESSMVHYNNFSITLKKMEFIALLPLSIIWVQPFNQEKFFGIQDLEDTDKLHAIWRSSVLLLIIINLIEHGNTWYWGFLEFLILLPMTFETTQLDKKKDDKLPVLTLFIQTEISDKLDVPLSLIKSVFLIMVAFLFEILKSRFWLLIILIYFAVGAIWFIASIIPNDMKSNDSRVDLKKEMRETFGDETRRGRRGRRKAEKELQYSANAIISEKNLKYKTGALVNTTKYTLTAATGSSNIQEKALELGQRVRTGIEKPYYTLNHILSTLKEEDFSHAWRVQSEGLVFPSTRGKWSPPKDLILFPVELEKYDYRRSDEILLLGFNRPFEVKDSSVKFEFGGKSKSNTKISDNKIKFGDVEFNTRSLTVTREQWAEIQKSLKIVTSEDDISHTGFVNLAQMQKVLVSMSDKWMEVRFTAQEAAVNFLAGFLGSSEPIFIPKEGISISQQSLIEGEIIDDEDTEI